MQQFFQFIILTFIYSSACFWGPRAHHQKLKNCSSSLWFYLCLSWSDRSARPRPTALLSPCSDGKPEAATAVVELLMMCMRKPETC